MRKINELDFEVLRGGVVRDDSSSYAVFTVQGSSASHMTAAKIGEKPKWALERRQAKVNTRPRSSPHRGVDKDATRHVGRTLRPRRTCSSAAEKNCDFCVCLRAVGPPCECCSSPFFCEVVARVHWHKSQFSAYIINVGLKKNRFSFAAPSCKSSGCDDKQVMQFNLHSSKNGRRTETIGTARI